MKKFNSLISVITTIAIVMCVFKIYSLENEIVALKKVINNNSDMISRDVNRIYSDVSAMLEKEASLVADSSWEYIAADYEDKTVAVAVSISPKEYHSGVTQAKLLCDDIEYPLALENGAFKGIIHLPLFNIESSMKTVQFIEGETIRTEKLDWYISPRYEFVTNVYADMRWSGHEKAEQNKYVITANNTDIRVDVEREAKSVEVKSIYLVEKIDGVETNRELIPLEDNMVEEHYNFAYVDYNLGERTFTIPFGSKMELFVETTDGDGFIHSNQLQLWEISSRGENLTSDFQMWRGAESIICDKEGNILYKNPSIYE